ncbi:unnamed protein product [Orchesella dallaii]|uniref:Reverse transcriptase domain-containing protein n=1 Tax=Orchesella dallaii TaxID=48710 RepID=A0ABP1Q478_9HEXA
MKRKTQNHNRIHEFLIKELETFVIRHKLTIKESDKNAGICVMKTTDYNAEIIRQLSDETIYRPSTNSEYLMKMEEFTDKVRYLSNWLFKDLKIKRIMPINHSPAKFYILPKIHKKFVSFPVGRPISSTKKSINKGIAMLLDTALQVLSFHIPDLLIDSPHLLLLLEHLELDPNRKYILVTADISAMYLELPIHICKQNCIKFFRENANKINFPFPINEAQLKILLDLCLDYSFLEFENNIHFQHKGIQMGNSASVSIANITAAVELENLKSEFVKFLRRFIDDIFMIVDITDLETSIPEWLDSFFKHNFLKFTYEYSERQISFLDLNINLDENNKISTSIYRKPMSKHEFLHFSSNHPKHLLKSLPYSSGLRVIRSCSDNETKNKELELLMSKFSLRGYPNTILKPIKQRLDSIIRSDILIPKSKLLIHHLSLHNPEILSHYNRTTPNLITPSNGVYIVFPFCNNIHGMGKLTKTMFLQELIYRNHNTLRKCILDLNVNIAFSIPNSINRFIHCVNANHRKQVLNE